jgi:hypothetical protein
MTKKPAKLRPKARGRLTNGTDIKTTQIPIRIQRGQPRNTPFHRSLSLNLGANFSIRKFVNIPRTNPTTKSVLMTLITDSTSALKQTTKKTRLATVPAADNRSIEYVTALGIWRIQPRSTITSLPSTFIGYTATFAFGLCAASPVFGSYCHPCHGQTILPFSIMP